MMSLGNFNAIAASRGEGLHPKLRELLERSAASPYSEVCALRLIATTRYDGLRPPAAIDRDHPFRAIATSLWTGVMEAVG